MSILDVIISAPRAWQTIRQLRDRTKLDEPELLDQLVDLEVSGMVASWEDWPEGISVTLTPLGAARLGVKLIEVGPREVPRWGDVYAPDPSPPQAGRLYQSKLVHGFLGEILVDPSPGPEEQVIAMETAPKRRRAPDTPGAWPDARRERERAETARKRRQKAAKARRKNRCAS